METKNTHSNETDITAVLVITFTVLVAILIAKVAGDFTKQTTSSNTQAKVSGNKTIANSCQAGFTEWYGECIDESKQFCPTNKTVYGCDTSNETDKAKNNDGSYIRYTDWESKCGFAFASSVCRPLNIFKDFTRNKLNSLCMLQDPDGKSMNTYTCQYDGSLGGTKISGSKCPYLVEAGYFPAHINKGTCFRK